jgi:hypothetical protein
METGVLNRIPIRGVDQQRARPLALGAARVDAPAAAGLCCAALALYLKTAAPGIYSFDAADLTLAAATWGIPHATGYPLFVLLGRLFVTLLPVGDAAYRMGAMTALFAALSVAILYALLRELRLGRPASALAAAAFGVSYYQWASAVVTKEHSLHDLLLAATLLLLARWSRPASWEPGIGKGAGFGWLVAATACYGLSLTNHLAAALYAPAMAAFALRTSAGRRLFAARGVTAAGILAGVLALSLLPYLYLPLAFMAKPAFDVAGHFDATGTFQPVNLGTWQGMLWMLSGRQFAGAIFGSPLGALPGQVFELLRWWWGTYFGLGAVLGAAGLKAFQARSRSFFRLAAAIALLHAAFFVTYAVGDRDSMFVPVYLLWAIPLAFGIEWLAGRLASVPARRGLFALLALGIAGGAAANYRLLDLSADQRPRDWAVNMLQRLPANATLLTRWDFSGPVRYEQLLEGMRPDVRVIDTFLMAPADLRRFVQATVDRQPLVVDDVSLLRKDDYPGICGEPLPGPAVDLRSGPGAGSRGPAYPGYALVRCP